jgi:hypothetical protein
MIQVFDGKYAAHPVTPVAWYQLEIGKVHLSIHNQVQPTTLQ